MRASTWTDGLSSAKPPASTPASCSTSAIISTAFSIPSGCAISRASASSRKSGKFTAPKRETRARAMAKRKTDAKRKPGGTTRGPASRGTRTTNVERLRDEILEASLRHVAFDGWTAKALAAGARDPGAGATGLARAFPGGPRDAAKHFGALTDRRMTEALGRQLRRKPLRIHERIAAAVRARLRILASHRA